MNQISAYSEQLMRTLRPIAEEAVCCVLADTPIAIPAALFSSCSSVWSGCRDLWNASLGSRSIENMPSNRWGTRDGISKVGAGVLGALACAVSVHYFSQANFGGGEKCVLPCDTNPAAWTLTYWEKFPEQYPTQRLLNDKEMSAATQQYFFDVLEPYSDDLLAIPVREQEAYEALAPTVSKRLGRIFEEHCERVTTWKKCCGDQYHWDGLHDIAGEEAYCKKTFHSALTSYDFMIDTIREVLKDARDRVYKSAQA